MELLQVFGFFSLVILTAAQTTTTYSPHPALSSSSPSYLLLAPAELCPGVPPSVSVTILDVSTVDVWAQISHGERVVSSGSAAVAGGSTERLILPAIDVGDPGDSQPYVLEVKGHVGDVEVFSNSTKLHMKLKGASSFIQTDKENYKAGQKVKIRVVSFLSDWKPDLSPVDIDIRDPRGNLLRQWRSLESLLGVVSKEFQLSKNPPLGKWTVVATVGGVSSEKKINVANYVLPRFEVLIDVPDAFYREDTVRGNVTAKYMQGKPVHGFVVITYLFYRQGYPNSQHDFLEINGTAGFKFDFPDDYYHEMSKRSAHMYDYYSDNMDEEVLIMVNVTEYLTGVMYNSTAKVTVTNSRYKTLIEGYSKILRPSLNFTAMVKICMYNNQSLSLMDHGKMLTVMVRQRRDMEVMNYQFTRTPSDEMMNPEVESKEMFHVQEDGVVPLNFQLIDDIQELVIEAHFEDSFKRLDLYRQYTSPSRSYLQIKKPSELAQGGSAPVGSPLMLEVEANFPITEIHYVVRTRGQVVSAGKSSGVLTLVPENEWAPMACVIVYCVHPNGEVVNDYIKLRIAKSLPNKVSLKWSGPMSKTGEDAKLNVHVTDPASHVWILVVDKATKVKTSNNDFTKEMVLKDTKDEKDDVSDMMTMGDPFSVFKKCGLVVLTDADLHMMTNPWHQLMLDMPVFAMVGGVHTEQKQEPRERWFFPETWIWMEASMGNSTSVQIPATVPDSITTWVASAFVMSENLGFGLVERPAELTVFQDFLLHLNLPAFIIRGEELLLEVVLFNYLPQDLMVTVTVAQSDAFLLSGADRRPVRTAYVGSQRGAAVHFPIKPLVLGEIPVSVKAESSAASDHVRRSVLVKAEGLEQTWSSSLLVEVSSMQPFMDQEVTFSFPEDVVAGSERASVTVVGDIVGPSIGGLDSLIQMPYGCGEQNMINFAPNIYVLQYLSAVGRADPVTTERAVGYMASGYERELSYQRGDGSFSAFGDQDSSGSTWLSAFVLRCFLQARPFIAIDPGVLHAAAAWLGAQQDTDGSYVEVGRVIHTELQGGLDGPTSLTAFVLIALLEDGDIQAQYDAQVKTAVRFLESRLAQGVSSNYSLSLLCYALALSGSNSTDSAISQMMARAQWRDGVPMWTSPDGGLSDSWQPSSADIEMASYLLLALQRHGQVADGIALMKWLSRQRNHRGGFGSTQDTIVALQALAAYATLTTSHDYDLNVRVATAAGANVANFYINQDNYLLHQIQQINPDKNMNLKLTVEGHGLVLFQLNVFYNIKSEAQLMHMKRKKRRRRRFIYQSDAFFLVVNLHDNDLKLLDLYICYSLSDYLGLNQTGMAILEVGLLSGFKLAPGGIPTDRVVKKVETEPGKVVLYLDSVTTDQMCVRVPMVLEHKIGYLNPAYVLLYDYYEPRRRTEAPYMAEWRTTMSTCSMFEEDWTKCVSDYEYFGNTTTTHPYYPPHVYTTAHPYPPPPKYPSSDPYPPHDYPGSDPYPPHDYPGSDPYPPHDYPGSDPYPPHDYPGSDPNNRPPKYPGSDPNNRPPKYPGSGSDPNNRPPKNPGSDPNNRPPKNPGSDPNNRPPKYPGSDPNNRPPKYPGSDPYPPHDYPGSDPYPPHDYPGSDPYPPPKYPGSDPYNPPHDYPGSDPYNPPYNYYPPEHQYGLSYFTDGSQSVLVASLSPACLLLFTFIVFIFGI